MTGALRAIAVAVEEPEPGAFVWVLWEQGVEWMPLSRSQRSVTSYAKAMASGLLALQALIDDLEMGPREVPVEHEPATRAAFGFGFGGLT